MKGKIPPKWVLIGSALLVAGVLSLSQSFLAAAFKDVLPPSLARAVAAVLHFLLTIYVGFRLHTRQRLNHGVTVGTIGVIVVLGFFFIFPWIIGSVGNGYLNLIELTLLIIFVGIVTGRLVYLLAHSREEKAKTPGAKFFGEYAALVILAPLLLYPIVMLVTLLVRELLGEDIF